MKIQSKSTAVFLLFGLCFLLFNPSFGLTAQTGSGVVDQESLLVDALKEELIGNQQKAIDILEKLKHDPEFTSVSNYILSRIYFAQGKKEEAYHAIELSIRYEPDNKWYLLLKSNIAENLALPEAAAACHEELFRLEPNEYKHYDNAAYHHLQSGSFANALRVLDKAESVFGITPEIAIKKSFILGETKKFKKAVELLENCLTKYNGHSEMVAHLHALTEKSNDKNLKEQVYSKYPPEKQVPDLQGNSFDQLLDAVFNNPASDLDTKIKSLASVMEKMASENNAQLKELMKYTDALLKAYPSEVKTHCITADLFYILDDLSTAKLHYTQAVELGNVPYLVWENLLQTLENMAHWNDAKKYAIACLDYYPNQSYPHYLFALACFKTGEYSLAKSKLATLEIMQRHKKNPSVQLYLLYAKVLDALNSDSKNYWEKALANDPTQVVILEKYLSDCTLKKALDSHDPKILSSMATSDHYKINCLLAAFYECTGDFQKARKHMEFSLNQKQFINSEIHSLAARIFEKTGADLESKIQIRLANELGESPKKQ
ncbi:MAG: hypothetical protein IPM34_04665 [Saprospiraceae bacterium]|nr:hypothetical protein [Saprospiraceae bacterium]